MKKLFVLALTLSLALALVGCGGNSSTAASGGTPDSGSASSAVQEEMQVTTSYFGKVNSVAGNEVELNLAKEPELPENSEPAPTPNPDGSIEAVEMVPATEATAGGGGAAQRVEVEYTGEMKSFVIPGGLKVKDAMGNEKQLSEIKKGSVMNFFVDNAGTVVDVFLYE